MEIGNDRVWLVKDHTADVMIEGRGKTLEVAFEGIALALQSVMVDIRSVGSKKVVKDCVSVSGNSYEDVLFEFLSKLVFIKDVKKFVFSDIKVSILDDNGIMKVCFVLNGEFVNLSKHVIFTDVKGISYCELKVMKEKDYYICRCVVDV